MFRYALQMCAIVRLLAVRDRPINECEPVIELLWRLDRLLWVESTRSRVARER